MCIRTIIDLNVMNDQHFLCLEKNSSGAMFRAWIKRGDGRIVSCGASQECQKILQTRKFASLAKQYRQNGRLFNVGQAEFNDAKNSLTSQDLESNDRELLAVALAGKVLVLYSEDEDFGTDFTDALPKVNTGKRAVYPHNSKPNLRKQFLGARKCSKG